MGEKKKERLDKLVVERGLCESRAKAQALIMAGQIVVNDQRVDKAGAMIPVEAEIRIKGDVLPYVSRGGLKLEAALEAWSVRVDVDVAVDLGASTGGFTDCLLQRGCRKVIAIDVGYGQLHPKLRNDERVINMERTNARYLTRADVPLQEDEQIDLLVADLSFISLELVIEAMVALVAEGGEYVWLIKPQFEVGREQVGRGGVVREDEVRHRCADEMSAVAARYGLRELSRMDCPIHGPKGNIEILMWLRKEGAVPPEHE
ncbi:MAG: TlyA family RNA methyltransferase [Myxococcales bacterium]|nr:TlyA family RNA methyltransferase [Myxococcales bacterium]MCB9644181.1 TlyA family RNA methyltransferase [Myxococcales bacterium]